MDLPSYFNLQELSSSDYFHWYDNYVQIAKKHGLAPLLSSTMEDTESLFQKASEAWTEYPYQKGKWSPLQLLEHIADAEQIFQTRLLAISRGHQGNWPGYDENAFAENGRAHELGLSHCLERLKLVRQVSLCVFRELTPATIHHRILADGHEVSALALVAIIAGHHQHHLNILHQRYPLPIEYS